MSESANKSRRRAPVRLWATGNRATLVDLAFCIGSECNRLHGVRLATRRGTGPCSIYIVCDECFAKRLTGDERAHMIEIKGAPWVRHLGLHELHNGRSWEESAVDSLGEVGS